MFRFLILFFLLCANSAFAAHILKGTYANSSAAQAACNSEMGGGCGVNGSACPAIAPGTPGLGYGSWGKYSAPNDHWYCYYTSGVCNPATEHDDGTGKCVAGSARTAAGDDAYDAAGARGASSGAKNAAKQAALDMYDKYIAAGKSSSEAAAAAAKAGEYKSNEYVAKNDIASAKAAYDAAMAACNFNCDPSAAWWSAYESAGGSPNTSGTFPDGSGKTRHCDMNAGAGDYTCYTVDNSTKVVSNLVIGEETMADWAVTAEPSLTGTVAMKAVDNSQLVPPNPAVVNKSPPRVDYMPTNGTGSALCTATQGLDGIWHYSGNCPNNVQPQNDFLKAWGSGNGVGQAGVITGTVGLDNTGVPAPGSAEGQLTAAKDALDDATDARLAKIAAQGDDEKITEWPISFTLDLPTNACANFEWELPRMAGTFVMPICDYWPTFDALLNWFFAVCAAIYLWRSATASV